MNNDYTAPLAVTIFARFTFYAALLFVVNLLIHGSLSVYLVAVSLYALVIVYQERGKRK